MLHNFRRSKLLENLNISIISFDPKVNRTKIQNGVAISKKVYWSTMMTAWRLNIVITVIRVTIT